MDRKTRSTKRKVSKDDTDSVVDFPKIGKTARKSVASPGRVDPGQLLGMPKTNKPKSVKGKGVQGKTNTVKSKIVVPSANNNAQPTQDETDLVQLPTNVAAVEDAEYFKLGVDESEDQFSDVEPQYIEDNDFVSNSEQDSDEEGDVITLTIQGQLW